MEGLRKMEIMQRRRENTLDAILLGPSVTVKYREVTEHIYNSIQDNRRIGSDETASRIRNSHVNYLCKNGVGRKAVNCIFVGYV